jgi:hypothetical protein
MGFYVFRVILNVINSCLNNENEKLIKISFNVNKLRNQIIYFR